MKKDYNTDDFLARWANDELSEKEKESFNETKEDKIYQAILEGTDALELPEYDNQKMFEGVTNKISKKEIASKTKVRPLFTKWAYGIAASVALLIGGYLYINQTVNYTTELGEQLAVTLPDNSVITLNDNSTVSYKQFNWDNNRQLFLEGEAFLEVEKGTDFTVETNKGSVTVLGTKFTVNTKNSNFEAFCFEGKIKVSKQNTSEILTKGKGVRWTNGTVEKVNLNDPLPTWLQRDSDFKNVPLSEVINAFEKQYSVTIDQSKINAKQLFTGSFTHTNLNTALRTVFETMNITFNFESKTHIVLSEAK